MIDDSLKETEALGKQVGNNLKSHLKEQNSVYLPNIKEKIAEGLKEYYEKLSETVTNELLSQESQQKNLQDSIDTVLSETDFIKNEQHRKRELTVLIKEKNKQKQNKALAFRFLLENMQEEKKNRKLETQIFYMRSNNLKKKIFNLIKFTTTFKHKLEYDKIIKERTETDLKNYEETHIKEKEEILKLIYKAEEKLKYENKKKIQTKLLLDQIVLRGVSSMNLQALSLSNNALKGNYLFFIIFSSFYF